MKKLLNILLSLVLLTACSSNEPELDLFHLTLGTEADAELAMGIHSAEITINGYARWIDVGIVGNFDSYTLSDDVPSWLTVIPQGGIIGTPHHFRIEVAELNGDESRIGKVGFTVLSCCRNFNGFSRHLLDVVQQFRKFNNNRLLLLWYGSGAFIL